MSKRSTIALAVVAAVLLGFIVLYEQHTLSSGELEGRAGRLIERFVRDRITKLEIGRGDQKIVLVRERASEEELGEWRLVEPVRAKADEDAVDSLLGALEWADARRALEGIASADRQRFGLASPRIRAWFTVANERIPIAIGGEDPTEGGVYLQLDDPTKAYVVGKDVFEALDHDAGHFRSKSLFEGVSVTRATKLSIAGEGGARRVELTDGRWWLRAPSAGWASKTDVEDALRVFDEIRAARFVAESPRDLAQYGLAQPSIDATAEIAPAEERGRARRARLRVGSACGDHEGEVYARADEGPVVCVTSASVAALRKDESALRQRSLATVANDELTRLEIRTGARSLVVRREDGAWRWEAGGRSEGAADDGAIATLLGALRDARVTRFAPVSDAELARVGLRQPAATVVLKRGGDEPEERIAIGRATGEEVAVRRGDEPVIAFVAASVAEHFDASPVRFRDRSLVSVPDESITRVLVQRGATREEVARDGDGFRVGAPLDVAADRVTMRELVRRLSTLEAERFVADRAAPEHGLASARFVVTFHVDPTAAAGDGHDHEDEAETSRADRTPRDHTLKIGAAAGGGAFAQLDRDPAVFVVPQALVDVVDGPLVSRDLLSTDPAQIASIRIERAGGAIELRRQGDRLVAATGTASDTDAAALAEALASLRAADTTAYGPAAPADGTARPRARIVVTRAAEAGDPRTYAIRIGAPEPGEDPLVHARREDLELGFLLAPDAITPFLP